MQEIHVAQIHDVIAQQLVVGLGVHVPGIARRRLGRGKKGVIGNQLRVRRRRVAHPDPDSEMALGDRIGFDLGGLGNRAVTMRIVRALAAAVEAQAMIWALHAIAFQLTQMQRSKAMRAAVGDGRDRTVLLAVKHDGLVQYRAIEQGAGCDFILPCRDIPGIA